MWSNRPMPLRPARIPCQLLGTSLPSGDNMPIPVMTTRLRDTVILLTFTFSPSCSVGNHNGKGASFTEIARVGALRHCIYSVFQTKAALPVQRQCGSTDLKQDYNLLRVGVDVIDGFLNSGDLFGLLVRDLGLEFLFQSHHQLNGVKGIGTQVFDEGSAVGDFIFLDAKLLGNDFLDAFFDGAHTLFSLLWKNPGSWWSAR